MKSLSYLDSLTTASLVQADKALNGPDSNMFYRDTGSIRGGSIYFFFLFLCFFQKSRYLFKQNAYKAGVWREFLELIVSSKTTREFRLNVKAKSSDALQLFQLIS